MSQPYVLTKLKIHAGVYEGQLTASKTVEPPKLSLLHQGEIVSRVEIKPITGEKSSWLVQAVIPANLISEGINSFQINTGKEKSLETLDHFSILAGEPLQDDLLCEISLLRAELDLLKSVVRRHLHKS